MVKLWQQGDLVELNIIDLSGDGNGVGKLDGKVVFVPDTVTGDRVLVRLVKLKSKYAIGKLQQLLQASPFRTRPQCIVADKCGGCQWQHTDIEYQLSAKQNAVTQALRRIGGFDTVNVAPILHTPNAFNYRNKSTYPLGLSPTGKVQAGYYRRGSHQIVNLNQCPVQDSRLHPLLAEVKQDLPERGWTVYSENNHKGQLRHLSLRIGRRTGEILLTLVSTEELPGLEKQAQLWLQKYPQLVGVALNLNNQPTNVIFGKKTITVAGKSYLREIFAGLKLQIFSDTFFQVNTEAAELLLENVVRRLDLKGNEVLLDAYCGIGTFTLPLARKVKQAIGIEEQANSIELARLNAEINAIANVSFYSDTVENCLQKQKFAPDVVFLDPPRQGCDRRVIQSLIELNPAQIVYISCKPATLARDLQLICQTGLYQLQMVQPADFFPQTSHVECAAFLIRTSAL